MHNKPDPVYSRQQSTQNTKKNVSASVKSRFTSLFYAFVLEPFTLSIALAKLGSSRNICIWSFVIRVEVCFVYVTISHQNLHLPRIHAVAPYKIHRSTQLNILRFARFISTVQTYSTSCACHSYSITHDTLAEHQTLTVATRCTDWFHWPRDSTTR